MDALSRLALAWPTQINQTVHFEMKEVPSIAKGEVVIQLSNKVGWLMPIKKYLQDGEQLEDKFESRKLRNRATIYTLIDGQLYRH